MNAFSLGHAIASAAMPVKVVMLLLLLASLYSWTIIFYRYNVLRSVKRAHDLVAEGLHSGRLLTQLAEQWHADLDRQSDLRLEAMFLAALKTFNTASTNSNNEGSNLLAAVRQAMHARYLYMVSALEQHLNSLATIGSISPYVGLFGTVWGIMNTFHHLGAMQSASISAIAPGISEALLTTGMGLFVAIPAVVAYNSFRCQVEQQTQYVTALQEVLMSRFQRSLLLHSAQ